MNNAMKQFIFSIENLRMRWDLLVRFYVPMYGVVYSRERCDCD